MNDFVNVPVPADRVQEVYRLLAQPANQPAPAPPDAGPDAEWTEELIVRMYRESAEPMRKMLKLLAEADGAEVSTRDIAETLELPKGASSVAGMAGAIGRRVNSRYGMAGLPWTSRWVFIDPADESKGSETLLALPPWICKVIRDL